MRYTDWTSDEPIERTWPDITVILGPVPCRACREPVIWGTAAIRGSHGKLNRWRDPATGITHKCNITGKRETA